jgi:hypothetical protein
LSNWLFYSGRQCLWNGSKLRFPRRYKRDSKKVWLIIFNFFSPLVIIFSTAEKNLTAWLGGQSVGSEG